MIKLADLNLRLEEIAVRRDNRPGTIIRPTYVTIHNTDNADRGADASAHSKFVRNTGFYILNGKKHPVSWHFSVDDRAAIQHLPARELAYHAGSGNAKSIAIEICMNQGIDQTAANSRAALLTAHLLRDLSIALDQVVTHKHWTSKTCPSLLLDNKKEGAKWQAFIAMVRGALATLETTTEPPLFPQTETESVAPEILFDQLSEIERTADLDHDAVREELQKLSP